MKTGDIIEWAIVDECGNTFAFRKTRREIRALLGKPDPSGLRGFRIAKVQVAK